MHDDVDQENKAQAEREKHGNAAHPATLWNRCSVSPKKGYMEVTVKMALAIN